MNALAKILDWPAEETDLLGLALCVASSLIWGGHAVVARPALALPGQARQDLWIIQELARRLGERIASLDHLYVRAEEQRARTTEAATAAPLAGYITVWAICAARGFVAAVLEPERMMDQRRAIAQRQAIVEGGQRQPVDQQFLARAPARQARRGIAIATRRLGTRRRPL